MTLRAAQPQVLVDPEDEQNPVNFSDVNASALVDQDLGILPGTAALPAPVPPPYKEGVSNIDMKRHWHSTPVIPLTREQDPHGDAKKQDETLDEELEDFSNPDIYHGPLAPGAQRQANDILDWSTVTQDIQPNWGGKRGEGSLKREIPATVSPPPPPTPETPSPEMAQVEEQAKAREKREKEEEAGGELDDKQKVKLIPGLLYTPDPMPPSPSPPSASDRKLEDLKANAYKDMNQLRDIITEEDVKKQQAKGDLPPPPPEKLPFSTR